MGIRFFLRTQPLRRALALACCAFPPAAFAAGEPPVFSAEDCAKAALPAVMDKYKALDPSKGGCERSTKLLKCDRIAPAERSDDLDEGESKCVGIYKSINRTVNRYERMVRAHCVKVSSALEKCRSKYENFHDLNICLEGVQDMAISGQADLKEKAGEAIAKMNNYEKIVNGTMTTLQQDSDSYRMLRMAAALPPDPFKCGRPIPAAPGGRRPRLDDDEFVKGILVPPGKMMSPLMAEQLQILSVVRDFRTVMNTTTSQTIDLSNQFEKIRQTVTENANKEGSLTDPAAGGKPQDNPQSDITGTDQKGQPEQQAGGGSGGGSPGGGSGGGDQGGGGDPGGMQSAAGPTAPTPSSFNPGAPPGGSSGSRSGGSGNRSNAKGGGVYGRAEPLKPSVAVAGPSESGGGLSPARTPASQGSGTGSSRRAAAKPATGGAVGGGGGGGGGTSGGHPCVDKDCNVAAAAQFAAANSLGSSPLGSLDGGGGGGGMGDSGSLDSLFGDTKAETEPPEGAEGALGELNAALDGEGEAGEGEEGLQAAAEDEFGNRNTDLFERVRIFHDRAQKRGLVVGMKKKL